MSRVRTTRRLRVSRSWKKRTALSCCTVESPLASARGKGQTGPYVHRSRSRTRDSVLGKEVRWIQGLGNPRYTPRTITEPIGDTRAGALRSTRSRRDRRARNR